MQKNKTILTMLAIFFTYFMLTGFATAEGDAVKGRRVFNKCKTCHTEQPGRRKIGPHLGCIIGRTSGTIEGFKYSKAMIDAGILWNEDSLKEYLANPRKRVPKAKMTFAGIRNAKQMDDLLAYISEATAGENC